jgi:hypothetical protein
VQWEIVPASDTCVRFDLSVLTPDIFALAGLPTPPTDDAPNAPSLAARLAEGLEKQPEAEEMLKQALDAAWDTSGLTGAALVYPWREEARAALVARLQAADKPTTLLRATDPLLVLNILSRARTHVLLANAPPGLERAFLERVLLLDDPRIVALALASGSVMEALIEPPEGDDSDAAIDDA